MTTPPAPRRPLDGTGLKRLHREWRRRTSGRVALVLDDVVGPFNVGAIVRTAAAYRVEHLWLAGGTPAPDEGRVGKTALGTHRYLSWSRAASGSDAVQHARADGYATVALELSGDAVPLHEVPEAAAVCLVVGHEDRGVSPGALAACDQVAYLPQLGRVGSLNVATATAIALYELRRKAWTD